VAPRYIHNNNDESILTPMITPDSKHKFKLFNLEEEMNKNAQTDFLRETGLLRDTDRSLKT
jgi:hypothetical protein